MSTGYAITSLLTGLGASSFVWSSGYTTGRTKLNDGKQDSLAFSASSAQASGQTLKIDLGSAQALVGIALLNHNLASGGVTVAVDAATLADYSDAAAVKSASIIVTTAPNAKDTILQFPSVNKRYWRLTFTHSGTKILSFGEILALGSITTLSRRTVWGAGEKERYVQNRNESDTGLVRATFVSGPMRDKGLPFKDLQGSSQREELMAMWRATRGGCSNLLWIETIESLSTAATAAGQEAMWGKLQESIGWREDDFQLFQIDEFVLVGLGREVGS